MTLQAAFPTTPAVTACAARAIVIYFGLKECEMNAFVCFGIAILFTSLRAPAHARNEWPVSALAQEGLRPDTLSQLDDHIRAKLPHVRSLLIARHGRLVFENYYGDASREGLQNMQSMTKSLSSALVGIALRKGLITSLDNRVVDYFPQYQSGIQDERIKAITIKQILTMSSGIDDMGLSFDKVFADPVAEILKRRLLYAPGHGFNYSSPAAHLLGGVLRKRLANRCSRLPRPSFFALLEWVTSYGTRTKQACSR